MDILQGDDDAAKELAAGIAGQQEQSDDRGDPSAPTSKPESRRAPEGGGDLQGYIGRQLRAVYDDVARQPIPERFVELMRKLEATGN